MADIIDTAAEIEELQRNAALSAHRVKRNAVSGAISQLYTTGRVVKSGMCNGVPTYRVNDLPYGCGNAMLIQFNQLLMECRREAV